MSKLVPWRQNFLETCMRATALRFGEFTLKSGRESPFFFNAGLLNSGLVMHQVGLAYARAYMESGMPIDPKFFFGPAYKGIVLSALAALGYGIETEREVRAAYNRKEAKDHGEGDTIVGGPVEGVTILTDDVITAGTAVREALAILEEEASQADVQGLLLILDRQEVGKDGTRSAVQEVQQDLGLQVASIITMDDIAAYLRGMDREVNVAQVGVPFLTAADALKAMEKYRDQWGIEA